MCVDVTWLLQMILEWEINALWFIDNAILLGPDSLLIYIIYSYLYWEQDRNSFSLIIPDRNPNPELTDMAQSFSAQTK